MPNVFVPVALVIVAVRALRVVLAVVPLRAGVVATVARDVVARAVVVDAVRAIVFVDAVRPAVCAPVRDVVTFALLRAVVARDCAPTTPLARDTTDCD